MKVWSAYPIRFLLTAICEDPGSLTPSQKTAAGVSARRLLEYALSLGSRDNALVQSGIQTVCRTYESDLVASSALLRKLLPKQHLESFGYLDMPALAREVRRLIAIDPAFVRDVYAAAFGFEDSRDEQTSMGPGRIMPLLSNRRQDYKSAHWQLGKAFPDFIKIAPEFAVEALAAVITAKVSKGGAKANLAHTENTFEFQGMKALIRADSSYIWDATEYRTDAHLSMLDSLQAELTRLASDANLTTSFEQLIAAVAKHNPWASVWKRLLRIGIANPKHIGERLSSLGWALPILTCSDTSHSVGEFIRRVYPVSGRNTRELIEKAILSIPGAFPVERLETAESIRDRLLGCIPPELVVTEETRSLIDALNSNGGPPPNRPDFESGSSFNSHFTEADFLAHAGVPVREPANRIIIELTQPVLQFVTQHSEKAPSLAEVEAAIPQLVKLHQGLEAALSSGAHQTQIDYGWKHLIALCACLARAESFDCTSASGQIVRKILLEGSKHSNPKPEECDEKFDDHASWSAAPRIDAAAGLLFLCRHNLNVDAEVIQAIEHLSVDPAPAVRLQIADHLGCLWKAAPATFDKLVSNMAAKDSSSSVVHAVINRQFWGLLRQRPDEICKLAMLVYGRKDLNGSVALEVKLYCTTIFLDLFLVSNHSDASKQVHAFSSSVKEYLEEAERIVSNLREVLVSGPVEPPQPDQEDTRARAFQILEAIIVSAQKELSVLLSNQKGIQFSEWPAESQKLARGLAQLLDSISSQLYFASGAYKEESSNTKALSLDQKRRFLKEAGKSFTLLSVDPHPSTVHHLIETMQFLLDADPTEAFLRIVSVVKTGKSGGYQYESLAIDLIVAVVNRFFADFRFVLQENQQVRMGMMEVLDVFVEAGWTKAIQLTYRLDEVFR